MICDYGCEREAKHQFKNGKWCCSDSYNKCSHIKMKQSERFKGENNPQYGKIKSQEVKKRISNTLRGKMVGVKNPFYGRTHNKKTKEKISNNRKGRKLSKNTIEKMILSRMLNIQKINERYPLFSKIEEIRYNPEREQEIQVHCKNHKCKNSKEKEGWFTPTRSQLTERRRALEHPEGNDGHYFYCSNKCKIECPLYNIHSDPFRKNGEYSTYQEYQQFRDFVLQRDNYKCQYCDEKAKHVHHERPQKLEPFFALDPDLAWSVCKTCHYEKGHVDECSTGKLASKICN